MNNQVGFIAVSKIRPSTAIHAQRFNSLRLKFRKVEVAFSTLFLARKYSEAKGLSGINSQHDR